MRRVLIFALGLAACGRSGVGDPPSFVGAPLPREIPTPEHGLSFDGDDFGFTPSNQAYDVDAFTVEVWARPDGLGSEMHLLAHHDDGNNQGWLLYVRNSKAEFRIYDGMQWDCGPTSPILLVEGAWHHFAGTFDGDQKLTVFLDGMVLATRMTASSTSPAIFGGPMAFGASTDGGGFRLTGVLDEARLSTGLRYTGPFAVPTDRFELDGETLGLWHFDEAGEVLDSGPHGLAQLGSEPGADGSDPVLVTLPPFASR